MAFELPEDLEDLDLTDDDNWKKVQDWENFGLVAEIARDLLVTKVKANLRTRNKTLRSRRFENLHPGLWECHLRHTWGYGWMATHASTDRVKDQSFW